VSYRPAGREGASGDGGELTEEFLEAWVAIGLVVLLLEGALV
jgi:hypothetical protein